MLSDCRYLFLLGILMSQFTLTGKPPGTLISDGTYRSTACLASASKVTGGDA